MSDPIEVACPNCSATYSVARADIGREATCHDCGARFTARRWNSACWWVVAAIVGGLLMWVQHERAEQEAYRRPTWGGFYLAVGVPGAQGVVAVAR